MRWVADESILYFFSIPRDIGTVNANQSSVTGITGVIMNNTTLKLLVDLALSARIVNNTGIMCEDAISGVSSQSINLQIIGKGNISIIINYNIICTANFNVIFFSY